MKCMMAVLLLVAMSVPAWAENGFEGRPITNNLFVPTGYTLHRGEFAIGIGPVAFGISENLQLETNILLWLFQVYNAGAKISLVKNDDNAFAVGAGVARLDLDLADGDDDDGSIEFTAVSPFASLSHRISPSTLLHAGARYSYFSSEEDNDIEDVDATATAEGTSVFGGIEYSMSNRTKFVADGGYDIDFEGTRFGGGVIFGWTTFRLKLGVSYFTAGDGFVFPNIGLWWRFKG
ncbi:MAG: hypothetical protein MUE60_14515 [Candidatus Eisenbacteria bacterium]|jgi:hypothetical protein|nr:hypothetical protein [Candidatus Eisenbacteria bacterium]